MSQTLQSVLCITTNIYLVRVLVVLLHACFSVVSPIPFLLAAIFFSGHPYIGSTTVLPDSPGSTKNTCTHTTCTHMYIRMYVCTCTCKCMTISVRRYVHASATWCVSVWDASQKMKHINSVTRNALF